MIIDINIWWEETHWTRCPRASLTTVLVRGSSESSHTACTVLRLLRKPPRANITSTSPRGLIQSPGPQRSSLPEKINRVFCYFGLNSVSMFLSSWGKNVDYIVTNIKILFGECLSEAYLNNIIIIIIIKMIIIIIVIITIQYGGTSVLPDACSLKQEEGKKI